MNLNNYNRLKPKYRFYFVLLVWAAIAISALPTWEFSLWLSDAFNIDADAPIKEQEGSLVWIICFLAVGILNMFLACVFLSYLTAKYNGWSYNQTLDYFVRYENFPKHWVNQ
jgi:hypothetical protein